jgi:hypothetical protein
VHAKSKRWILFYLELRNSKLKFQGAKRCCSNQLANNLKFKTVKCFGITFSTKRSETRHHWLIVTRKNLFGHANNQGNSPLGRIARNRHDWIVIVSSACSLRCAFVARNGRTAFAVHRLNGHDFAVLVRPMMASFRKSLCKFCPKLAYTNPSISLFCRCMPLIIYILHNNICLMCLKVFMFTMFTVFIY